eukprot:4108369-Prymnesium_polylepis.1
MAGGYTHTRSTCCAVAHFDPRLEPSRVTWRCCPQTGCGWIERCSPRQRGHHRRCGSLCCPPLGLSRGSRCHQRFVSLHRGPHDSAAGCFRPDVACLRSQGWRHLRYPRRWPIAHELRHRGHSEGGHRVAVEATAATTAVER